MAEFNLGRIKFVWKGDWTSPTTYVRDDVVRYGGKTYICVIGHEADANFYTDFENIPARWNQFSDGQEWTGDWLPTHNYNIGDIVKYGGDLYICKNAHTSATYTSPTWLGLEDNSGNWDLFAESFDWKTNWTVSTRYKVNDIVKYSGITYICNTKHISNALTTGGAGTNPDNATGLEADLSKWDILHKGIEYRSTWSGSAVRYKVNDVVKYGAGVWICITPHTSTTTFAEACWEQFVEGLEFNDTWTTSSVYQPGDIVTYGGYVYLSKTNNTNQVPTSNSDDWDLYFTGFKFIGDWGTPNFYRVGNVVRNGGFTYLCITDNEASSGNRPSETSTTYWARLNGGFVWRNEWKVSTLYSLGDVVKVGPNSFTCVQTHTSSTPSRPDNDTAGAYWNIMTAGSEIAVLTTLGDLVYYGGAGPTRLPIGDEGQVLKVNASDEPEWAYFSAINHVYYVSAEGTDAPYPTRGNTIDNPWNTIRYAAEQIEKGTDYPNSRRLLEMNRIFIQKEVIQWITYQIANAGGSGIWNGFTYDSTKCERDVGYLIDRVMWDIGHGGNLKMRAAAQSYLNALGEGPYSTEEEDVPYTNLAAEADNDVAAFNYMSDLIENVINQTAPAVNYQVTNGVSPSLRVAQFTDVAVSAESGVLPIIDNLVSIVTTALTTQDTASIPDRVVPNYTISVKTGDYREVLPIIVPASTAVVGDELRSTSAGPAGSLIDPSDAYYTVTTFDRISDVVGKIVAGTAVTPSSGNTVTQSAVAPLATATETTAVNTLVQLMKHQSDYRVGSLSAATLTDPTGYNTSYLIGYGDARKLIRENKAFLQAEVVAYLELNYPTLKYGKTRTKRDAGYIVDAIIYDLTYGGNALSVQAGLAYWDGDDATQPQIPTSIKGATIASVNFLKTTMQSVATNTTVSALQATIPQFRGTAGSAGASTFIGTNIDILVTILTSGPLVSYTLTDSTPANGVNTTTALINAYNTLTSALPTIKTNVATYLSTNYSTVTYSSAKAQRDTGIILKAVGFDFMYNSNYQTIKAAYAYLRETSSELFQQDDLIKEATRNSLEYARTQAIANVGGDSTAISRINTLMAIVDAIVFGGSYEGSLVGCPTEQAARYYAALQLERNRDFIVAEVSAYITSTFTGTATATDSADNSVTVASTSWLKRNVAIKFTGTTFGGITQNQTYYVQDVISSTKFTIATTRYATSPATLTTVPSGSCTVSLVYDSSLCLRDVGLYIDALKYDLAYPGNYRSRYVARYYANAVLGSLEEDMYYVRNGTGIRNMTLTGLTGQLEAPNDYGTSRTTAGAYVSLDPGWGPDDYSAWIISRSPYIQNVTTFGTACVGQKIDGNLHNGGNDSIVSNDFTQVLSDGIGAWVTNLGRAELVSVFSYYGHIGYLAENGGKIRATNGNSSYGTYGTVSEGVDITETPISGEVNNRSLEALVDYVFTDSSAIQRFEFSNAGIDYNTATFSISGGGTGATTVADEFRDDGVYNIRLTDPGDSSGTGGTGYKYISNIGQSGTSTSITIAATDSAISSAYVGMRIILTAGTGVGQFGYIQAYDSGTKIATVYKESTGTAGWDHIIPGTTIATALDASTGYAIEPRLTLTSPSYASTARTIQSGAWTSVAYGDINATYTAVACTGGSGGSATFNVVRTGNYYSVTINSGGTGYTLGNTLTIAGTNLGGASPANDITLLVQKVTTGIINNIEVRNGYGQGGRFVAIAGTDNSYSADGTSWTAGGTLGITAVSIAYGNGTWVAISATGTTRVSTNGGTTWAAGGSAPAGTYANISYGNGRFVMIGGTGSSAYSTNDGTSWVAMTSLPTLGSGSWVSVAYGRGVWVAVASTGTVAASSSNGTSWTSRTIGSGAHIAVAYGKNMFVAVRTSGTTASYSLNGTTWSTMTVPSAAYTDVSYGQGLFFAVSGSTAAASSEDGINWTSRTMSTSANGYSNIAFGNPNRSGIWAAVQAGAAGTVASSVLLGCTAQVRAVVTDEKITTIRIIEPGSGYASTPALTITDPNNIGADATATVRKGKGVLANPTFTNRGTAWDSASAASSGNGYADLYQIGKYVSFKNLTDVPRVGANVQISSITDVYYKLVSISNLQQTGSYYSATLQLSPLLAAAESPDHLTTASIRFRYSQVRLTGHDFLSIGTGNFASTNYPGLPYIDPIPANETVENAGGRVFYTSTDQDGNFRVGDIFSVEQSTGIATLNADAFSIAGLQELSLGSVSLGGGGASITEFSTDPYFTADSDSVVPTQRAIKAYISNQIGSGASSLIVNTLTAGVVFVSDNTITTTTNVQINVNTKMNFNSTVDGYALAYALFK